MFNQENALSRALRGPAELSSSVLNAPALSGRTTCSVGQFNPASFVGRPATSGR